jgi:hypothetical protein
MQAYLLRPEERGLRLPVLISPNVVDELKLRVGLFASPMRNNHSIGGIMPGDWEIACGNFISFGGK